MQLNEISDNLILIKFNKKNLEERLRFALLGFFKNILELTTAKLKGVKYSGESK